MELTFCQEIRTSAHRHRSRGPGDQVSRRPRLPLPLYKPHGHSLDFRLLGSCSDTGSFGDMGQSRSQSLHIIPLPKGAVLLPGITLRIPIPDRPDIISLISTLYARPKPETASISVGCVPLKSRLLSANGQQLIDENTQDSQEQNEEEDENNIDYRDASNLFTYGTAARITGVQGRKTDLTLTIEGGARFKIERIVKTKPFLEAAVTYPKADSMSYRRIIYWRGI